MNDTVAGRDDSQVVESLFTPLKESESFSVTLELKFFVAFLSIGSAREVDLHGVIDDEVNLAEWVDLAGVAAKLLHGSAHGS